MKKEEFRAAREEILRLVPKSKKRKVFGIILGYDPKSAAHIVADKERGNRKITRFDEYTIRYLLILKRFGLLKSALEETPEFPKIKKYLKELDYEFYPFSNQSKRNTG